VALHTTAASREPLLDLYQYISQNCKDSMKAQKCNPLTLNQAGACEEDELLHCSALVEEQELSPEGTPTTRACKEVPSAGGDPQKAMDFPGGASSSGAGQASEQQLMDEVTPRVLLHQVYLL
jgi:hypothetical protein